MPPGTGPKVKLAPRLPPLPQLRVRRPTKTEVNPCVGIMASLLSCWASSGQAAQSCRAMEQQLRACTDMPKPPPQRKPNINFHLGRMYPKLTGPTKKK